MRALLLLALAALVPGAHALDAFPQEDRVGRTEARFLVRVQGDAPLRVEADGPVRVQLARPGEAPDPDAFHAAPADLRAPPGASWHGLPGVVELVARRDDPGQGVLLTAWQDGSGVALEWAAERKPAPGPGPLLFLAAAAGVLLLRRR